MYFVFDLYTPVREAFVRLLYIKNTVLRVWPRLEVNGVEVFDRLIIYEHDEVVKTDDNIDIYKIIGTTVDELEETDYEGIKRVWLEFKITDASENPLTSNDIASFMVNKTALNEEYKVTLDYNQRFSNNWYHITQQLTNDQLKDMVLAGHYSMFPGSNDTLPAFRSSLVSYDTDVANPATFLALSDKDEDFFHRSAIVKSKTVTPLSTVYNDGFTATVYTIKARVEFTFTRYKDPPSNTALLSYTFIGREITTLANQKVTDRFSFATQIEAMVDELRPLSSGAKYADYSTIPFTASDNSLRRYVRVDAAEELTAKDFYTMFSAMLDSGYKKIPCSGWECVVAPVLLIAVVVAAVMLAAPTGGASITTISAAASFLAELSAYLAIGAITVSLVASELQKRGQYGLSYSLQHCVVVVNKLSEISGYASYLAGIGAAIQSIKQQVLKRVALNRLENIATNAGTEIVAQSVVDASVSELVEATTDIIKDNLVESFTALTTSSTGEVVSSGLSFLNEGLNIYMSFTTATNPSEASDIADTTELEGVATNAQEVDIISSAMYNNQWCELSEAMDGIVDELSAPGLMRRTLDKYFIA